MPVCVHLHLVQQCGGVHTVATVTLYIQYLLKEKSYCIMKVTVTNTNGKPGTKFARFS